MLNFAKRFSEEIGCEGRFHLRADPQFTMSEVPHIFYRKCDMSCKSEVENKKLDEFIRTGRRATIKDFKATVMYYPKLDKPSSNKEPAKTSFWGKFKKFLFN
jgi:hypothetical protein